MRLPANTRLHCEFGVADAIGSVVPPPGPAAPQGAVRR